MLHALRTLALLFLLTPVPAAVVGPPSAEPRLIARASPIEPAALRTAGGAQLLSAAVERLPERAGHAADHPPALRGQAASVTSPASSPASRVPPARPESRPLCERLPYFPNAPPPERQ